MATSCQGQGILSRTYTDVDLNTQLDYYRFMFNTAKLERTYFALLTECVVLCYLTNFTDFHLQKFDYHRKVRQLANYCESMLSNLSKSRHTKM